MPCALPIAPTGPNARPSGDPGVAVAGASFALGDLSAKAIEFIETLRIPEGPKAGEPVVLAPFQKQFLEGALAPDVNVGVLSVARGNAKSAVAAGVGLAALSGVIDTQPRREIILAARTREQAAVVWTFVKGFIETLPEDEQKRYTFRRSPRLEIEYEDETGSHFLKAVAADGKSLLGGAPTLAILDERGAWPIGKGDDLEAAILSGLGKRGGRCIIISTSAPDDSHPFSVWLDQEAAGVYRQEHKAPMGLPADDLEAILLANPGAEYGIGATPEWLLSQAKRSLARGGSTLTSFRLFNLNQRVSDETRDVLLTVDEWLNCETAHLPPREGECVLGIDLGGSSSMTAFAAYWPATGRLEVLGTFPSNPGLGERGANDHCGDMYSRMRDRGELNTMGDKTVPVAAWLEEVWKQVEGEKVACLIADRYRQSELGEAIDRANIRVPVVWRGTGWRDGGEDIERFRRAAFDGRIKSAPSLLMRTALSNAVCLKDVAANLKLAKARSHGRIDPVSASVLAVAEGMRRLGKPSGKARAVAWV